MKTLYLDLGMGVAGDMLMSALSELLPNQRVFIEKLSALGIPNVNVYKKDSEKCGIVGTHISISVNGVEEHSHDVLHEIAGDSHHNHDHNHEHHEHHYDVPDEKAHHHEHSDLNSIFTIIKSLNVSEQVKKDAIAVYKLIADAESKVHGKAVSEVHFHEVGTMDAIADIIGVCMLMELLAPDRVLASAIHLGSGKVKTQHGILPVPAPATALLLQGIPVYSGEIRGELCTPTGAALVKHFVSDFCSMPVMTMDCIGYGMGNKDFEVANCVRAILGETQGNSYENDTVSLLSCNVDDMTGEAMGYAIETIMAKGALDAYATPIFMKKGRPAYMLSCLVKPHDEERITHVMLKHTTTIGVRKTVCSRTILNREFRDITTPYGDVKVKICSGDGIEHAKIEYEDKARIARENDLSLQEIDKIFAKLFLSI